MRIGHRNDTPPCECEDRDDTSSFASGVAQGWQRGAITQHYENAVAYLRALGGLDGLLTAYHNIIPAEMPRSNTTIGSLRTIIWKHAYSRESLVHDRSNIAALFLVSDTILDNAKRRVESAEERFAKSINDPRFTPGQLDDEQHRAQWDICDTLKLVRDHNGDDLPQDLERIWTSWSCTDHLAKR